MLSNKTNVILEHNDEDISTYSNFDKICQKSLYLEVTLDFPSKTLYGFVTSTYEYINKNEKYLILDLKGPKKKKVSFIENKKIFPLEFQIISNVPIERYVVDLIDIIADADINDNKK